MSKSERASDLPKNVVVRVQDDHASLSQRLSIGILPDDVLLQIFKSYLDKYGRCCWYLWSTLALVCQRWRHVVFASPRYLDLQIFCTTSRSPRCLMSGWPALPIAIRHIGGSRFTFESGEEGAGNIIAGLEHNNRQCRSHFQLTSLTIGAANSEAHNRDPYYDLSRIPPTLPDSFLGGSAPFLQSLRLDGIPFPGLLKLLSSSHHLVDIHIWDFAYCLVYIPPEEMITRLSMKHLESLDIKFNNYEPSPAARQPPPSLTRIVLPALTALKVNCTVEFLEGFVSRLDAPSLKEMEIKFPRPFSNISELPRFISRIETFETFDQAIIHIHSEDIQFVFSLQTSSVAGAELSLTFGPVGVSEFIEDLPPVVCSLLPPLSRFKCLMLHEHRSPYFPIPNIANTPMEGILYSFTGVTNIFISKFMATSVSRGMELSQAGERATAMLPALRNIFVDELRGQEECTHNALQQFIAAKGLAGRPVTLHRWEPEADD